MGGVDRADQLAQYYKILHRSLKWWKKVFYFLIKLSFCNSYILYAAATEKPLISGKYRLAVVHSLLDGYERPQNSVGRRPDQVVTSPS